MEKDIKEVSGARALGVALLAAAASLAFAYGLSRVIRHDALKHSHQRPTPEAWVLSPIVPTPETVARGRKVFLGSCAHCHGADASGDEGPDLHGVGVSDRYVANIITHGIKGEMPSFRKKLGADDIHVVTAYIRSLGEPEG